MAFKKIHSLVSFLVDQQNSSSISVSDVEAKKSVIFIHCAPTQRNMSLRMTGDGNVINCGDSSVGLSRRVCICASQTKKSDCKVDRFIFLAVCTDPQHQWHLNIFALGRLSFFSFLSNDRVHFTRYFNFYSLHTGTEHNASNEPIEVDSFQFIPSKNLSPFRMTSLWFSILSYSSSCHRSFAAEWNRHSIIIFMFHILRVFWWQTWTNELAFSLLVDGFSLIFY